MSDWIPVTERLPKRYTKVLIAQETGAVFIAMWEIDDYWLSANELEIQAPTHWMPLPSPPGEDA